MSWLEAPANSCGVNTPSSQYDIAGLRVGTARWGSAPTRPWSVRCAARTPHTPHRGRRPQTHGWTGWQRNSEAVGFEYLGTSFLLCSVLLCESAHCETLLSLRAGLRNSGRFHSWLLRPSVGEQAALPALVLSRAALASATQLCSPHAPAFRHRRPF